MTDACYRIIHNAFSRAIPIEMTAEESRALYSEEVKTEILELCKTKKYTPVIADYLCQLGVDVDFWKEQYTFFQTRNIKIRDFVVCLFQDFHQSGVKSIFVYENFGALLKSDTDIALYASGDVDLCANESEMPVITEVLNKNGFKLNKNSVPFFKTLRVAFSGKIH